MTDRLVLLASLQQRLDDVLRPLVSATPTIALLDFPDFANVGDSAIWLGALATLNRLDAPRPCYTSDVRTYDRRLLARRLGDGTILLNGGGSFGDLWGRHQDFRERVIADFPNNPIVQLPQSLHFSNPSALARAQTVFDRHPGLTLLLRDDESLVSARQHFRATCTLAPDLAFGLAPSVPGQRAQSDVLWLKRDDLEARWPPSMVPAQHRQLDWANEERTRLIRWHDTMARDLATRSNSSIIQGAERQLLSWAYPHIARQRFRRGMELLGSARVVVTDRLHGHILCMLLGMPHVVLDNTYRKLSRFIDTWTRDSTLVRLVDTPDAAVAEAATLASVSY